MVTTSRGDTTTTTTTTNSFHSKASSVDDASAISSSLFIATPPIIMNHHASMTTGTSGTDSSLLSVGDRSFDLPAEIEPIEAFLLNNHNLKDPAKNNNNSSSVRCSLRPLHFKNIFCGRDTELIQLEGIFRRTAALQSSKQQQPSYPNMVLIGGTSGAGKSTVVRKLKDHLSSLEEEFFWVSGKFEEQQQQQQQPISNNPQDIAGSSSNNKEMTESSHRNNSIHGDNTTPTETADTLNPFAAIVDAFSVFCQELQEEEPETMEDIKNDILQGIGDHAALLCQRIPGLTDVIGDHAVATGQEFQSQPSEVRRFHLAFQKFLQALASSTRSVVLVLDDIFRADTASLELLKFMFTQEMKHVMFIGTYREDEVHENHRFIRWIQDIKETQEKAQTEETVVLEYPATTNTVVNYQSTVTTIKLAGLDLETVNVLIGDLLGLPVDKTRSLAHIVLTKTDGNAFYVCQYLLYLKNSGRLWFDDASDKWLWDEERIRRDSAVTTTLTDFMKEKVSRSEAARKILPLAACLGAKFNRETLGMVLEEIAQLEALREVLIAAPSEAKVLVSLKQCEKEGFIENCGNKNYSFTHDAMQHAALVVHPPEVMDIIRCEAGSVLFQKLDSKELDEKIFVVVSLLNTINTTGSATPLELATLNLKAAEKAKHLAAFSSAATYAETALSFLPEETNDEVYRDLTLKVCSLGAEVEGAIGRLEKLQHYCDRVTYSHYHYNTLEQLRVQNVRMECYANNGGQMTAALQMHLDILENLECSFPKTMVGQGFRSVTSLLKSKSSKNVPTAGDIESMALMVDPVKIEAMRLLDRAATYAYIQTNHSVFLMGITRMVRWTIRYGLCDKSPAAFALMGTIMMHVLGDYKLGVAYGELALLMIEKLDSLASNDESKRATLMQSACRGVFVANCLVLYWAKPLNHYNDELIAAYNQGMRAGDTESALWSMYFHLGIIFMAGTSLQACEELCRKTVGEMVALQREEHEVYTRVVLQALLNLLKGAHGGEGNTRLSGSVMQEEQFYDKKGSWGSNLMPNMFYNMKVFLCTIYGDFEQGAKFAIERGNKFADDAPGNSWSLNDPFIRGLCLYSAAATSKNKRSYRRHADHCRSTVRMLVGRGNTIAVHHLKLLNAEHEALVGKLVKAKVLYQEACSSAIAEGFTQDAALANERFAELLLSSGNPEDREEGKTILMEAARLYQKWGAKAKTDALRDKYSRIFSS